MSSGTFEPIPPRGGAGRRILIADDDPVSRTFLLRTLEHLGYAVDAVADGAAAWRRLQAPDAPRLAILDWMMPEIDGPTVCRRLRARQQDEASYVYVILLTSRTQKADLISGLDAGADDYVAKPFDRLELQSRLRAGHRIVDLEHQLREAQETLRHRTRIDPLTGLWNRAAILDILDREIDRAARTGATIGAVLADVDHFKTINDTHGHQAGDAVLQEVALRMRGSIRSYDELGRYGGEEFLLVVPDSGALRIDRLADRVRGGLAVRPVEAADLSLPVTASFGVAIVDARREPSAEVLLKIADDALYRAKASGRNRVEVGELGPDSDARAS